MSTLVNSLKRIYVKGFITAAYLDNLLLVGKITQDEYNFIVGV